ncbi:hypothetical protein CEXT_74931 [Caerostris extrusa]|uniref:Uncharacterized protein n=1 Tax=Caerostris extrusa TaxID=172846 RepID=A0AAV4S9Y2_CAEEX|nr:hypothetical protein CEXT_74931 [Caerostris extrusa]
MMKLLIQKLLRQPTSLYLGRCEEARKNSSGFMDFLNKIIILLLGTIGCSIILGVTIVVPISMILVGDEENNFGVNNLED